VIDYHEDSDEGFAYYAKVLKERGYVYGTHYGPHDIVQRELGTGKTRIEIAKEHGIDFTPVNRLIGTPRGELAEGINAVRLLLPRCWFDEQKTSLGRQRLSHYRWGYNALTDELKSQPVGDINSHGADAFRYVAAALKPEGEKPKNRRPLEPSVSAWV
jgi:hypothetical protein